MKGVKSFSLANKIAIVLSVVFLAGVFCASHFYTKSLKRDVLYLTERATQAVLAENWIEAREYIAGIEDRTSKTYDLLKLMFDHEDIDTLETEVNACMRLMHTEDASQILPPLEIIKNIVTYLAGIETFSIPNLF